MEIEKMSDENIHRSIDTKCPFCGEIERLAIDHVLGEDFYVKCLKCYTFGPTENTEEQAIEAWNRRATWVRE